MDFFKNNVAVGVTAAIAAGILAPILAPILIGAGRPLAKSLVKGGVLLYEKGRETAASAGEVVEDMIAEVRAELEQRPSSAAMPAEDTARGGTAAPFDASVRGDMAASEEASRRTANGA
jgi:hypothetical protein